MADVAVAPTEVAVGATTPEMGPLGIALQRLRRNKLALGFGGLFLLIVIACAAGPGVLRTTSRTPGPTRSTSARSSRSAASRRTS